MAVLQTVYAFFDPFSQVAYAAHVGGFLAGLLMAFLFKPSLKRIHYYI
ncbi:MAG: rhomboid family intramembrane serine protease [Thaumarchaeota archaeon]|nr:rhomboid family intramembrane serine protease [Nitrososphaerota archaeon]